jgi:hypothetical protein
MTDLYFWAQSLDNQAPDLIFKNEEELSDDESRQKLVSEIYEIPKSNIEVLPADAAVTIRYSYPKFIIEAIPTQKDTINRFAPIVIYAVLPDDFSEDGLKDVYNRIESVVSDKLKRTLDPRALKAIENGLSKILQEQTKILKKKTEDSRFNLFSLIKVFLERLANGLKLVANKLFRR